MEGLAAGPTEILIVLVFGALLIGGISWISRRKKKQEPPQFVHLLET